MSKPSLQEEEGWKLRAEAKGAIVPEFWEVYPTRVTIACGRCGTRFCRNLIPNVNDPTFVCPNINCGRKNFVPITYL